ncbi:carbohydrate ABC transporter permease [Oceanispirochaeta sp.]|jgi:sorbitol/mannitol transport system permease protein|uniref:carbohydrate ABC transporter permease n=1 Tax=Oceanispirochaeta sp. TaxID=2035350 RepID=UPI00261392E2|nr:carbohydrate ABC transporter permease [Oceanispirochaeta sp.]MDA3957369.1 carbohydrate ABC transporter permease [Oceanispirochaeta sp.]
MNPEKLKILRRHNIRKKINLLLLTLFIFAIAILYFSPILYMFLTSFKTEHQAVSPSLIFKPTLNTLKMVLSDANMFRYLKNSLFQVFFTTLACLVLAVPASFALVFGKFKKRNTGEKIYVWFITTILLPPVAVIIPLYTWYQKFNLIKSPMGLLIAYIGFHVPIVVWMLHSFFKDVPKSIIEASEIDGCSRFRQLVSIAIPLVRTGIISSGLLVAIFVWNEFFLGFNLTGNSTATLPVYMSRFREQQGMFVAQLSASSTVAILPAVILGWITQKSLVKGLTLGAVKG